MAALSTDLATIFLGLARLRAAAPIGGLCSHLLPLPRTSISVSSRLRLHTAAFPKQRQRAVIGPHRRFATSVDARPTEEDEDDEDCSGVKEMMPPDNRIPATIITGFLGSGKVQGKTNSAHNLFFFIKFIDTSIIKDQFVSIES